MNSPDHTLENEFDGFDLEKARSEVCDIVLETSVEVLRIRNKGDLEIGTKAHHGDLITKADAASEQLIVERLKELFPDHKIRGEEGGNQGAKQSLFEWVIDPIDGTMNYSDGNDGEKFGISVGLLYKGIPVMGVIAFPESEKVLYASKGMGAHEVDMKDANESRIQIGKRNVSLKQSEVGFDFTAGDRPSETIEFIAPLSGVARYPKVIGCATESVRLLLKGYRDAYIHPGATPFDIAAAVIIAREAGATVSGIKTDDLDFSQEHIPVIFASSVSLRDQLRELFQKN